MISKLRIAAIAIAFALPAQARDLYPEQLSADASFVRVLTATKIQSLALDDRAIPEHIYGNLSAYYPIEKDNVTLQSDALNQAFSLKAKRFYTIILTASGAQLLEDPQLQNPNKAMIRFYNLSGLSANITAPDFNTEIFAPVTSGSSAYKEINALELRAVAQDAQKKTPLAETKISLQRRIDTSLLLLPKSSGQQLISYNAKIER